MAAPEYFIKLKFGTEVDQKAFNEIQEHYNSLSTKQRAAFSKNYNATLQEMDKLFLKQNSNTLKKYEKSVVKTEQTISAARIKELRNYVQKRDQALKNMPGYFGGAMMASGTMIGRAAIANSFSMTQFEKNTLSGALTGATTGATAGWMVGGPYAPITAAVGGAIGAVTGVVSAHFENKGEAIRKSAELFNQAVQTYRSYIDKTIGMYGGMRAAGMQSVGQYEVYRQALRTLDIDSDAFVDMIARNLMGNKKTAGLGQAMAAGNRADALTTIYNMWQKSGMSAREYALTSVDKGGLGLSRNTAAQVIALLEGGGLQQAIYHVLKYSGLESGENATALDERFKTARDLRLDLELQEWASDLGNIRTVGRIGSQRDSQGRLLINRNIVAEGDETFARNVDLMSKSTVLLDGINVAYQKHAEEVVQITSYIADAADYVKSVIDKDTGEYRPSKWYEKDRYSVRPGDKSVRPQSDKLDEAEARIYQKRALNKPKSVDSF